MIDTRAVGQELQDQVLGAARKGRERVTSTVKTVTATAQHIRPQLTNLPKPNLTMPTLPTPAQLREKGPALAGKLPWHHQLVSGAQELAGHARSVQRLVVEQVRTVAAPLAQQAATRLARIGAQPTRPQTATRVSEVHVNSVNSTVNSTVPAKDEATTAKSGRAATGQQKAKPKARPTTK